MTDANHAPALELGPEEKLTSIMIYTQQAILAGKVVSKQAIRVSTWMRSDMAPQYFDLREVQLLFIGGGQNPKATKYRQLFFHTDQIIAYHLMPPDVDPPDYDPDEPNRKLEPTRVLVGPFQFDGYSRMSEKTDLRAYLSVSKGEYMPLYQFKMSCPILPAIKGVQADFILVRQAAAIFTLT